MVWVTFNESDQLNAMTQALRRDLAEFLADVQMDDSVRVLVFTGSRRSFCAGDDLGQVEVTARHGACAAPQGP